jgi:hypothetical protein
MTLRFFRKHRKLGIILLISAVFAMVTFGVLSGVPKVFDMVRGNKIEKATVMEVYGKKISRLTAQRVRENLGLTGQLNEGIYQSLMKARYSQSEHREESLRTLSVMATFASPMPVVYAETADAADREKVVEATLILLEKAEQMGLRADEGTGAEVVRQWQAAGMAPQEIAYLRGQFFGGSEELMQKALAQDLVLNTYINMEASCGRVFKEDVTEAFRSENDKAELKEVTLPFGDFTKLVAAPTEAEIKAQYEKYRDVVAGPQQSFGYKVPDRVKVAYVSGAESDFEPTVTVSDSEIQAYYEEHKEKYALSGSHTVLDFSPENLLSGAAAGKAGTGANVPSGLPAKVLNAPELPAHSGARVTVASGVRAGAANVSSGAAAGEVSSGLAAPGVRYKPLSAVREDIERKLRKEKAAEACFIKIREAYVKLSQKTSLGLENVADGKLLKIHDSETFLTEEQAAELPGIGLAKGLAGGNQRLERRYGQGVPFAALAFAIKPFSDDPVIHKDRVVGPLVDEYENSYLFKVTAVEAGHTPAALAEVKDRVIADLKKKAAYELALKAGEALKAAAEKEGLATAAKAQKLTVETPEAVGRDEAVAGKLGTPRGRAVFETADAGKKVGLVGSETFDAVRVFAVEKVTHGTPSKFEESRADLVGAALRQARGTMVPNKLSAIEALIRESGAKMIDTIDYRETKKGEASSDTGVATPEGL